MNFTIKKLVERSVDVTYQQGHNAIHESSFGSFLEDFELGRVFSHPRGMTLTSGFLHNFHTTFLESNPMHLNVEYAKSLGHPSIPASSICVLNIVLSLGVQNNSEKAYANLGYYDVHFLASAYAGDTLTAYTKIADVVLKKERKFGIITLHTVGVNQRGERIIQYVRKIMVPPRPKGYVAPDFEFSDYHIDNFSDEISLSIPSFIDNKVPTNLTTKNTLFNKFSVGDVYISPNGRTISDEHFAWSYRVGNTHPLHSDLLYSQKLSGAMSGAPIVYGGLVFAWLLGLGGRDLFENAIWDMGYTQGYHTQPAKTGDTLYVFHRVLGKEDCLQIKNSGILHLQMIGVKNIHPRELLDEYGADVFIKEHDKKKMGKEKISNKVFEIERKVLLFSV